MFNMQMSREDVEKILDLQIQTGNMSEKLKEEKLREYDMLVQQRTDGYPRIKTDSESYLNTPEMLGTVVIAILIVIAAMKDSVAFVGLLMGILFTYIGVKIIYKDIKAGKGLNYISVIATIAGILMTGYGFFKLFGNKGAQSEFDRIGNMILPFIIIGVGLSIIIGFAISINRMKTKYTIPVQATCIQLVIPRNTSGSPRMRSPIYEYSYNGETRRTYRNVFSNRGNPAIDEVREIYVSDIDDGGYYDPVGSKTQFIFATLMSLIFIVIGGIVVYLTYFR